MTDARTSLVAIKDALDRLSTALDAEHRAILGRDFPALERSAETKTALLEELHDLSLAREADATEHPVAETATLRIEIEAALQACQRANEINGAMVAAQHIQTQRALATVTRDMDVTYGADGHAVEHVPGQTISKA